MSFFSLFKVLKNKTNPCKIKDAVKVTIINQHIHY